MMKRIKSFFTNKILKFNEHLAIKLLSQKVDSLNEDVLELSEEIAKIKAYLIENVSNNKINK